LASFIELFIASTLKEQSAEVDLNYILQSNLLPALSSNAPVEAASLVCLFKYIASVVVENDCAKGINTSAVPN
jgi:hypothetical protein